MNATNTNGLLGSLALALMSGRIRIVDLTQTLSPDFPAIALPPEMGQCQPFRIEQAWMAELNKVSEGQSHTLGAYYRPWK